jgi:phage shock protein A
MQEASMQQQVVKLDTQARQALAANREDLARVALERKQAVQTELQSLDSQIGELEDQQQKLVDSEAAMRGKIEAFKTKKEVIKAQYSAAEAQVRISEAATGVGEQMADVGLAMQRALDKTENMKARAAAVGELESSGTFDDLTQLGSGKDDIDRQLEAIGAGGAVDDELSKLKAELGSGAPTPALGAPAVEEAADPVEESEGSVEESEGTKRSSGSSATASTASRTMPRPVCTSSTWKPSRRSIRATSPPSPRATAPS